MSGPWGFDVLTLADEVPRQPVYFVGENAQRQVRGGGFLRSGIIGGKKLSRRGARRTLDSSDGTWLAAGDGTRPTWLERHTEAASARFRDDSSDASRRSRFIRLAVFLRRLT